MGSNRNLVILLAVLVVLAGMYALSSQQREHIDQTGGFVDLVEGQLSTDEVYGISITKGGDEGVEIVQRGDRWEVDSYHDAPANLNKVRSLLGNLESVEGELRSEDPAVLPDYSLDDENAYHIVVREESGTPMVDLRIGTSTSRGVFVRRSGSDTVYLADHNFLSDLGIWGDERKVPEAKSWVDLQVLEVDENQVVALEIRDGQTLRMEKEFEEEPATAEADSAAMEAAPPAPAEKTYEWRVTDPESFLATRTKAEAVLNSLSGLRASDVVTRGEAPEGSGLGDDASVVVILGEEGPLHTLRFGASLEGDTKARYLRVDDGELIWSVPEYVCKNVLKTADDLRPE